MANNKVTTNNRNLQSAGKPSLLPPKSPFPSISPTYADYGSSLVGPKSIPKAREVNRQRQRTPSESFLLDEQPSWLEDLLNEPETPVRKGSHRRSSSDSFAYLEAASNSSNIGAPPEDFKYRSSEDFKYRSSEDFKYRSSEDFKYRSITSVPSWGSLDFDRCRDVQQTSFYMEDSSGNHNKSWESPLNSIPHTSYSFARNNITLRSPGSSCAMGELDKVPSTATEKQDQEESGSQDVKGSSERKDSSQYVASDTDSKRTKQQFAQRSRVRKLQYIAELERTVQALQVEGLDISAELEFLGQQNIILSMENKALKQRLDSLAQEQLIKYMEHEVLEREIARLRALLYQQPQQPQHPQQQQQPPLSTHHRRSTSRDLDTQFANLSLKHKEASSSREPVSGPLQI